MMLQESSDVKRRDVARTDLFSAREPRGRLDWRSVAAFLVLFLLVQQGSSADPISEVLKSATDRYSDPNLSESERRDAYRDLFIELSEAVDAAGESSAAYEQAVTQLAVFALMGGLYEAAAVRYDELFALGIDKKSSPRVKEAYALNASVAYLGAGRLDDATAAWNHCWGNIVSDNAVTEPERLDAMTFSTRWLRVGYESGGPLEVSLGPLADFYSSQNLWDQFDVNREPDIIYAFDGALRVLAQAASDGRGYLLPGLIKDATDLRDFFELRATWDPNPHDA